MKSLRSLVLLLSLLLVGCDDSEPRVAPVLLEPAYYGTVRPDQCCMVIAHAGGAIDGNPYSNSQEAIQRNFDLGTRWFELDFQPTKDAHWVGTHDWPHWKRVTGFEGSVPPSLQEFESMPIHLKRISWSIENSYTAVSMPWLGEFLTKNAEAMIVTDVKDLDRFEEFVDVVLNTPVKDQFIFQAYNVDHVDLINRKSPTSKVILTLYRIGRPKGLYEEIKARNSTLVGVTVPMNWAYEPPTMNALAATGVPIFLHGAPANINSRSLHADFAKKGVSGFYLD